MARIARIAGIALLLSFGLVPILDAQLPGDAPAAPVPSQIATAKKVFISNAGEDPIVSDIYGHSNDFAYNQLFAAMKSWGKVEVAASPTDADLILEISFKVALNGSPVVKGDSAGSVYDPQLELRLLDPKTRVVLWGFHRHVPVARLKGNREKDSEQGVAKLIEDTKNLIAKTSAPPAATSK